MSVIVYVKSHYGQLGWVDQALGMSYFTLVVELVPSFFQD